MIRCFLALFVCFAWASQTDEDASLDIFFAEATPEDLEKMRIDRLVERMVIELLLEDPHMSVASVLSRVNQQLPESPQAFGGIAQRLERLLRYTEIRDELHEALWWWQNELYPVSHVLRAIVLRAAPEVSPYNVDDVVLFWERYCLRPLGEWDEGPNTTHPCPQGVRFGAEGETVAVRRLSDDGIRRHLQNELARQ